MAGSPAKVQMVELGPGRGTMADDMLRVGIYLQCLGQAALLWDWPSFLLNGA